jgi:hypothetical protein
MLLRKKVIDANSAADVPVALLEFCVAKLHAGVQVWGRKVATPRSAQGIGGARSGRGAGP